MPRPIFRMQLPVAVDIAYWGVQKPVDDQLDDPDLPLKTVRMHGVEIRMRTEPLPVETGGKRSSKIEVEVSNDPIRLTVIYSDR
ncbi:hypothetical protein SAMN05216319_3370 [Duganella sp. CF402]|uniref:hypothetical protein n=1 Tax=unclassified Duganella TaxID=2636909 RepID=UPI0008D289AE|nr:MULTISPECIES: hypothetical protein [unclassified Duganella]RZT08218.1 hypothetical protein EV582_0248 [Duganella sp. BK701]SEM01785.1 hypothetical protein SAMN05216319_3370 [Duganella sp. CF402]